MTVHFPKLFAMMVGLLMFSSCSQSVEPDESSLVNEIGIQFVSIPGDNTTPSFEMAATEISNEQYAHFLNEALDAGAIIYNPDTERVYTADGKEMIWLGGSRVVKDHNSNGIYELEDMENPLNICYIRFLDESQTFEVKDPAQVDWHRYCDASLYSHVVDSLGHWAELSDNENGFCGEGDMDGLMPTLDEVKDWPVTFIRWYGADAFAQFYGYDLPLLTQWKLAGRGGENFFYATSDGSAGEGIAWINIDGPGWPPHKGHAQPVDSKMPNPLGVYNLGGNVWEWTKEWYRGTEVFSMGKREEDFYVAENPEDPNHLKGLFGGSFNYFPATMGLTWNHAARPNTGNDHFGFRVVRNVE